MSTPSPVLLCILDGFGYRDAVEDNAIKLAQTPTYDRWWSEAPRSWLKTSGLAVGLPDGQMGNSEVGHMNIGSGRVVMQDLPKINEAVADGTLETNARLQDLIASTVASKGAVHLMGLLSPGGVHSHQDHMVALADILTKAGLSVHIHAFLDGRDTAPKSALDFVQDVEARLPDGARIATLTGRYYAMDRDKRWDRVEKAYSVLTHGAGASVSSATAGIEASYSADLTDEFVLPVKVGDYAGMADGDSLLMANFRADRAREILTALLDPAFDGFTRGHVPAFSAQAGMVDYSEAHKALMTSLYPSEPLAASFGEVVADAGLKQLRIAETEKYAHVTFFFNGGSEAVFSGEDRILVPSPDVATYDLQPEMSAHDVTDKLVEAIKSGTFGAIVVNYANPDMVGHTGVLSAAITAVETIDTCLARLEKAIKDAGGVMLVTADHGNVELMRDETTGAPHTAHTHFDVPVVMIGDAEHVAGKGLNDGSLQDVAPTLLALMGLDQPSEMSGQSLLSAAAAATDRQTA